MASIIVAIVCNLIAALILVAGIFNAISNGWKVSLVKFALTCGALIGTYFLTPALVSLIIGVEGVAALMSQLAINKVAVSSVVFILSFLIFDLIIIMICSIVKHCLIKSFQNKKLNRARMKRAQSINPRAERAARKSAWKALKYEYKNSNSRWWKKLLSIFLGMIISVVIGLVVLMPFGVISNNIVEVNPEKVYLNEGYGKTLNGLIGDDFFNWVLRVEATEEVPEETPAPEEIPCEHSFESGSCTLCGEPETPPVE